MISICNKATVKQYVVAINNNNPVSLRVREESHTDADTELAAGERVCLSSIMSLSGSQTASCDRRVCESDQNLALTPPLPPLPPKTCPSPPKQNSQPVPVATQS